MSKYFKVILGYAFALLCIYWVFRDFELEQFINDIGNIKWGWILIAVIFDVISYISQGYRWKQLLKSKGEISVLKTTECVYVGLLANELLPFRIGEFIRTLIVSRSLRTNIFKVFPSIGLERLFDAFWLFVTVGLAFFYVPLPSFIRRFEDILGVITIAFIILLVYFFKSGNLSSIKPDSDLNIIGKLLSYISISWRGMIVEINNIGLGKNFFKSLFASLFIIIFQIISFYFVILALSINLGIWQSTVVYLIIHIGTAIPNAPANIGSYQFFCVIGLTMFGLEKGLATSFSVVIFIVLTVPLILIGLISLHRTNFKLSEITFELKNRLSKSNI